LLSPAEEFVSPENIQKILYSILCGQSVETIYKDTEYIPIQNNQINTSFQSPIYNKSDSPLIQYIEIRFWSLDRDK